MKLNYILKSYLNNRDFKKSFLVNGTWGVGKTFFLKNFFKSIDKKEIPSYTHYCFINGYDINSNFDIKKYIVHNSFLIGSDNLSPLFDDFISNVKKNYDKLPFILKNTLSSIEKSIKISTKLVSSVDIEINSITSNFFEKHLEYVYQSPNLKKCVVIIDELDRANVDLNIIFCKIIDLLENYNLKVILVANLEKISDLALFNLWYEKLVDFDFKINSELFRVPCFDSFTDEFKEYFFRNNHSFDNYRSYLKYLTFESIINKKYKHFIDKGYKLEIFNSVKEQIFYTVFMNDNSRTTLNSVTEITRPSSSIFTSSFTTAVEQFVCLNMNPLYDEISTLLITEPNNDILMKQYSCYIKSKQVYHCILKEYSISNPSKYIFNIIIENYSNLNFYSRSIHKDFNSLDYWVTEFLLYPFDKKDYVQIQNCIKFLLEKRLDYFFNEPSLSSFDRCCNLELMKFSTFYNKNLKLKYSASSIAKNIRQKYLDKLSSNPVVINDYETLLFLSMNVYNFFEIILLNSNNYEEDFLILKRHIPSWLTANIEYYLKNNKVNIFLEQFLTTLK